MVKQLNQIYQQGLYYDKVCFYEKMLVAQQEKANALFDPCRLSVKHQLLAFIQAELNYFNRKRDFDLLNKPGKGLEAGSGNYRVKVNLSADALAYLIRLLCETSVIDTNPRTQLMDFIARSFQTAGIGDKYLSAQSLGTKYKQVTQNTALGLKAMLQKMMKQIDTDFKRAG